MRRIGLYESAKGILDQIYVGDLAGYQAGKLLYASAWGMYGLSLWQKLKRVLALVACDPICITEFPDSTPGSDIALEIIFRGDVRREDNAAIFHNLYEYLKPCRHVLLEKKYQLNLTGIPRRLARLCKYAGAVKGFSLPERLYLAAQLVLAKGLAELLDSEGLFAGRRYLLIFQEYDTISSLVIQNAHHYGVKVISPQHGMSMNRHENMDQLVFDGFLCDYKLVWNDFEREQYLSAGIDPKRIFVVGNTKELGRKKAESSRDEPDPLGAKVPCFGVLLNCPSYDGAVEANGQLLAAARMLATRTGMRYLVKPHPIDDAARYSGLADPARSEFAPPSMPMDEYRDRVAFSLANATGAIFDLIYEGKYVFQYVGGERYPVDLDDIYKFRTAEELAEHFSIWKDNYAKYAAEYRNTVEKYSVADARERHDRFFERLFAGELG